MNETERLMLTIERVPYVLPHVRVFRRSVFEGKMEAGWYARAGIPGMADAWCFAEGGRYLEIECKSHEHRTRYSKEQKAWRALCDRMGIKWIAWEVGLREEPEDTITRWIKELKTVLCHM